MALTNAQRQAAFRERLRAEGKTPRTYHLTDDEAFFIERTLKSMRECQGTPAMLRLPNGRLTPIDV